MLLFLKVPHSSVSPLSLVCPYPGWFTTLRETEVGHLQTNCTSRLGTEPRAFPEAKRPGLVLLPGQNGHSSSCWFVLLDEFSRENRDPFTTVPGAQRRGLVSGHSHMCERVGRTCLYPRKSLVTAPHPPSRGMPWPVVQGPQLAAPGSQLSRLVPISLNPSP